MTDGVLPERPDLDGRDGGTGRDARSADESGAPSAFDGSDLTIVVPVWKRTHNLPRLYESVAATVPQAQVLLVVNSDDEQAKLGILDSSVLLRRCEVLTVEWPGGSSGDYARKINAGYRATDRPAIFTGADDVEFTGGWYQMARPLLHVDYEKTPAGERPRGVEIGVVGTVDGCNGRTATGDLSTHSLVARWYADLGGAWQQPGTIYYEGYPHEYVDDELCEVAKLRGAYRHAFASVVLHHHHLVGAPMDETYEHGKARTRESRSIFLQRQRTLWGKNTDGGIQFARRVTR